MSPGKAYLVGEERPEIFAPGRSGSISPGRAGSGGGFTKVEIHNHGGNVRQQQRRGPNGERELMVWFEAATSKFLAGDKGSQLMGSKFGARPVRKRH